MSKEKVIIDIQNIDKYFHVGEQDVQVLKDVSLEITEGDFMIIFGSSGSGKSTLLHILLGLEIPTKGTVSFLGDNLYTGTSEDYRSDVRKKHIGMVYQQANWIKALSVAENIAFPLQLLGMEKTMAVQRAKEVLKTVHLEEWADYYPTELSSGQQQRISMARALINNPMIIVADEPTGNLDYESGEYIMQILSDMNTKDGKTIIMVTHDLDYLKYSKTAVQVFDGEIVGLYRGKDLKNIGDKIKMKVKSKKVRGLVKKDGIDTKKVSSAVLDASVKPGVPESETQTDTDVEESAPSETVGSSKEIQEETDSKTKKKKKKVKTKKKKWTK